jgi:hypothetical protein
MLSPDILLLLAGAAAELTLRVVAVPEVCVLVL